MKGLSLTCQCEKTLDTCSYILIIIAFAGSNDRTNFNIRGIFVSRKIKFEGVFFAMLNNFHKFEELVFFDLWIPYSVLRIPNSGFRFPGFKVAQV